MLLNNRLVVYMFKVQQKISKGEYVSGLMRCPECGIATDEFTAEDEDRHVTILQKIQGKPLYYVVVGCEGYFTIDPKKLGMPRNNWQPVWEVIKKTLSYYISEAKTYSPAFAQVTEDNKPDIAAVINRDGRLNAGEKANLLKQLDD